MKKVLILCVAIPVILAAGFFGSRFVKNRVSVIPYPFYFSEKFENTEIDAPILIIGDRMGERLSTFTRKLSRKISQNSTKPIKIQTLTKEGQNIHRTFNALKNLDRLPLVILLINNMDENYEQLFNSQDRDEIVYNFNLYENINLQSLMMIFPALSKIVYKPVDYLELGPKIPLNTKLYEDHIYLQRQELLFKLYSATTDRLFQYTKKRASVVIPITTPLNLQIPPLKNCYGTIDSEGIKQIEQLKQIIQKRDYKSAFNASKELVLIYPNHAESLYYHSQVLYKLNRFKQAHRYGEMALTFDCLNKRGNPIFNEILTRNAAKHNITSFDFHAFLADESTKNYVFIDDIYPQDFYLEKLTDILALKIQKLLKLR